MKTLTESTPLEKLNSFTRGYIIAAFWTFDDESPGGCDYSETSRPEAMYSKLDDSTLMRMVRDCRKFKSQHEILLRDAGDDFQNGIDFWLTRNGHGAGFWDRCYNDEVSDGLSSASKQFGMVDLYVGDDGKIYM